MNSEYSDKDNDQIDILELIRLVWLQKKTIFKFVLVFTLIGVFMAIFTKDEYQSSVTLVPQVGKNNKMGGLGGLAAMAGINIGSAGGVTSLSPKLYEKITASVPFRRALLQSLIQVEDVSEKITFKDYYETYYDLGVLHYVKKYTVGLPGLLIRAIRGEKLKAKKFNQVDGIYRISKSESDLFKRVGESLVLDINDEDGIVIVKFTMPEALSSAQMVKATQELLQSEITKFKTEKINSDYHFINKIYKEAKDDFFKKQLLLANYKDRNHGVIRSRSNSREERLKTNYNLSYSLYSELSKELSSQKIMLKKSTPIFTVLEPISVPLEKSKPKRSIIIAIWLFLGFIIGVSGVLINGFLKSYRSKSE